jgi:hypothetical protein
MTRRSVVLRVLCLLVSLGLAPAVAAAQTCSSPVPAGTCTASTTTTMTAGTVLQLALTASATALTAPGTADYDAGFVADNGPSATVKANRSWTLKIAAVSATWTAANTVPGVTERANKPAGDLQWSSAAGGPFAGVTVAGATAKTGSATASTVTAIYFHTLYSWTLDTPGAYSLVVVLTLTAP